MWTCGLWAFLESVPDEVLRRMVAGESSAVGEFAARFYKTRGCVRHLDEFEDVIADLLVLMATQSGLAKAKSIGNPRGYFWAAFRRRAYKADIAARCAPSRLDDLNEEPIDDAALAPEAALEWCEQREVLGKAIRSLTANEQVVATALLRGSRYREIAAEIQRVRGRAPAQSALRKAASRVVRKLEAIVVTSK